MESPPRSHGASRPARILAAAVLLGGLALTLLATHTSRTRHRAETARVFAAESAAMHEAVTRQLELFLDVLASIGQLHELSDRISPEDFEEFASKGMQFQARLLGAYGFAQRIPHTLRAALAAGEGEGLKLLEPDPGGGFVPAAIRPDYFPLVYQRPPDALALPEGTDFAALPGGADAILRMQQHRGPAIARQLRLQTTEGGLGYFVFSPLGETTPDASLRLTGFTVAILWPQELLARALANIAVRDVLVRFHDPDQTPADPPHPTPPGFTRSSPLAVADQTWTFQTVASPEYLAARTSPLPGLILAGGSAVTLLLTTTILLLAGQARRIETTVLERTRELKTANQQLSTAMAERMRLEAEILDIAEREKRQVGQDLHDSLGQKLTGAVFLSRALAGQLDAAEPATREQAVRITDLLKETVTQVRRMARGLSPVDLGDEGLPGALRRLAEDVSSVFAITCLFQQTGDPAAPLPPGSAHHLYALSQEAANNAVRHGHATEIVIELHASPSTLRLSIDDNGGGFDPDAPRTDGLGLRIMHYRAAMIGGTVSITRRPEGGMRIACTLAVDLPAPA